MRYVYNIIYDSVIMILDLRNIAIIIIGMAVAIGGLFVLLEKAGLY